MPMVQQEQIRSQPSLGTILFGPDTAEQWARGERPPEAPVSERGAAVAPAAYEPPTTQRRTRPRRRHIAGIGLYELVGQTLALIGTLVIAGLIWAVGAYFTLRFLDAWGAQAKLGLLLATFGVTPSAEQLYWITRSAPLIMTVIEIFFLPRWNWPWTPTTEQVPPSKGYRWLIFGAVLTPDVWTTAAGLSSWIAGVVELTARWSLAAAIVLGIVIAIIPEKMARWVVAELKTLWTPIGKQIWQRITQKGAA